MFHVEHFAIRTDRLEYPASPLDLFHVEQIPLVRSERHVLGLGSGPVDCST
jgi:hypothetical protein